MVCSRSRWTAAAAASVAVVAVVAGCSSSSDAGEFKPVPTRTTTPTPSQSPVVDPGGAVGVRDFMVPQSYSCLDTSPPHAIVTAGWTAPSAGGVRILLDGVQLPAGLNNALPYQVPAGGPTGIGATVAFECSGPRTHTITVEWTATGLNPATRTVTITQEPTNG